MAVDPLYKYSNESERANQLRHLWWLQIKKKTLVSKVYKKHNQRFNPLTAKLFNLNFHPPEVVSRWRDPQLQVSENYSDLQNRGQLFSIRANWCHINALTCLKGGTECDKNWVKNPIYSAPAAKGLRVEASWHRSSPLRLPAYTRY